MADERAARFRFLISEIEVEAERIRLGLVEDTVLALMMIRGHVDEASAIAAEVSREALDKVVSDG